MAVKRILRYLKSTTYHGLSVVPSSLSVSCFTDADWASCPDDRRSTSGYCTFLGSNLISWSSSKQKTVSRSSAESEYRGLTNGAAEIIWVVSVLQELGITLPSPPLLLCDNISATHIANNPVMHQRTKHIEIDQHFAREKILRNQLLIKYVPSEDQVADILTKGLPTARFQQLRLKLTVLQSHVRLRGMLNNRISFP